VIRNSDQLSGFTDHEIEVIALIARYHRKSLPKADHAEFKALSADDQRRVRLLAGMLRVGIALDRTRQGGVDVIEVALSGDDHHADSSDPVAIEVRCHDDVDLSLEMYTAETRLDLLESGLERAVELRFVSTRPVP
jgi:exopolyphosphatase/guanosine-5'-triphosphate,3'-diphosphate pyrophosphatase